MFGIEPRVISRIDVFGALRWEKGSGVGFAKGVRAKRELEGRESARCGRMVCVRIVGAKLGDA